MRTQRYGRGGAHLPEHEDASMDYSHSAALTEVLSRRRTAYLSPNKHSYLYSDYAVNHEARGKWFKPQVTLSLGDTHILNDELKKSIRSSVRNGIMARAVIDVVSDGMTGFARLKPNCEQPVLTEN